MKIETFKPGKIDRRRWIGLCVQYFKNTEPAMYAYFVADNTMRRNTKANKFGVVDKKQDSDLHEEGARETLRLPTKLLRMINAEIPDPDDGMKMKPVIDPPFLVPGQGLTKEKELLGVNETKWFIKQYPEFSVIEKY